MKKKIIENKLNYEKLFLFRLLSVCLCCVYLFFFAFNNFSLEASQQTSNIDAGGVWAFFMLDLKANQLLTMTDGAIDDLLQINHSNVDGIAPRFSWSTLNPAPGEYNWTPVDKVIERARAYNKKVVIRIIGGGRSEWTPGWLWLKIKYVDHLCITKQAECRLPIIWDTEYLSAWTTFVKALGARYDSNPLVQRVAVTGGSGGELYYLRGDIMTNEQIQQVIQYGFYDNFVPAWKMIIDNYAVSFPTKPLFMDMAPTVYKIPTMNSEDKEEVIANYAISKFGRRLYLQQDGLHENTETAGTLLSHAIMKSHAANGNIIGFATLVPAEIGNLRLAFENALTYPTSYVEVFTADLKNANQQNAIKFIHDRLASITPASLPHLPSGINEGDLVRGPDGIKVYIVNYYGWKRHIFNPAIFNMYGHFKWDQIRVVDQPTLNSLKSSDFYRADGDPKVFSLKEIDEKQGKAQKRWMNFSGDKFTQLGFVWDQVFIINTKERDYYQEGTALTEQELQSKIFQNP